MCVHALLVFEKDRSHHVLPYQIAFYGLGLNSSVILSAIGFGPPSKNGSPAAVVYQALRNLSLGNLILSLAGLVPGYWAAFCFIDRWGRKPIQFMGFSVLTVLFIVMGAFLANLPGEGLQLTFVRALRVRI